MAVKKSARTIEQLEEYEEELEELVARAMAGRIPRRTFEREMLKTSTETTLIMFMTGGGNPKNPQAKKWLDKQKTIHRKSAKQLAEDIYSGRYNDDEDEDG